jgi:predicted PurR-regulated permease PerM
MDSTFRYLTQTTYILVGILAFFTILYIVGGILIPLVFSALLSFAVYPIVARLERWHIPRVIAILVTLLLIIGLLSAMLFLIGIQISSFTQDIPNITQKFNNVLIFVQDYLASKVKIKADKQLNLLLDSVSQLFSTGADIISTTISTTSSILFYLVLMPIYMFFMLYYNELFRNFIIDLAPEHQKELSASIVGNIKNVVQNYVGGMVMVIAIVATLNTLGFWLIDIQYAIFFGFLISLLAIIPYFGILIGSAIAILYTFLTTDSLWYPAGVLLITACVQFLEGNFITPFVMGSQIQVNPLVLMVMLLFGNFLWGPAGMILSVPMVAITKMVCDNIDSLKPFGRVLGTGKEPETTLTIIPTEPELEPELELDNTTNVQETYNSGV